MRKYTNPVETERLKLELYDTSEKNFFVELVTDKEVMRRVGDGVLSREKAEELWQKLIDDFYQRGVDTIWAVLAKDDGRFIGNASLRPRPTKKEDWEISYYLKADEWGKGLATEIARRLVRYGFDELNLDEIFATVDNDHSNSQKVLRKVGMKFRRYDYDEQGSYSVYSVKRTE